MRDGKREYEWDQVASINYFTVVVQRDPKAPQLSPDDFNPYASRRNRQAINDVEGLRVAFQTLYPPQGE